MPTIIKDRQLVEDPWQTLEPDTAIDALPKGPIIVPLGFWLEHGDTLTQRGGELGVMLSGDDKIETILADLDRFDVIALQFPQFRDGRAYSMARTLRLHGYKGEIRAVGEVLRDQIGYMARVGFNAFVVAEHQKPEEALKAFGEISVKYQASSDEPLPLYRRRSA